MSDASSRRGRGVRFWHRGSGVRLRLWMAVNVTALSVLSYLVWAAVVHHSADAAPAAARSAAGARPKGAGASPSAAPVVYPTVDQLLHPNGLFYGVATPQSPFSDTELAQVTQQTGVAPTMTEFFVKWDQDFDPKAVTTAYQHGTVPVLSWEPWLGAHPRGVPDKGTGYDVDQPQYQLAKIYGGSFDAYVTRFAKAVAANKAPVVLRFAHEMNGTWYPWSEQVNGNHPGDYAKAWRHLHDLFQQAGATNVIWAWSPNIMRPVPNVKLAPLYPGDAYVDWIGLVGYGAENDPAATFGPTLTDLRRVTEKPVLITETSAAPAVKAKWTAAFFPWLLHNPNVIGFVWFDKNKDSGGTDDWRFDADAQTLGAYRAGIQSLKPKLYTPATASPSAAPGGSANTSPAPSGGAPAAPGAPATSATP